MHISSRCCAWSAAVLCALSLLVLPGMLITFSCMWQVEVPSVGSPEDDERTVDLKLRQVQKNKGAMKVPPPFNLIWTHLWAEVYQAMS